MLRMRLPTNGDQRQKKGNWVGKILLPETRKIFDHEGEQNNSARPVLSYLR